jgi:hypothetical protein
MSVGCRNNGISLIVADIPLSIICNDKSISFNLKGTSNRFIQNTSQTHKLGYDAIVCRKNRSDFPTWTVVFNGIPWDHYNLDYRWYILQNNDEIGILVDFDNHPDYNSVFISINATSRQIKILVDSDLKDVLFDPFTYPVSVLAYIYLVHYNGGLMIHASGVIDGGRGYLFTGLSGIGKSTMAKLWQQKDATIINDDRLMIVPDNGLYKMHNTPMPYYTDVPKQGTLSKIFLLKQSPQNYCRLVDGSIGYVRFMANCIQHFHSHQMVKKHLDIIENISSQVPIYELGFFPNTDIVDLIRSID